MSKENGDCPYCKRTAIKLIAINDNGKGVKVCKQCKKLVIAGMTPTAIKRDWKAAEALVEQQKEMRA